MKIKGKNIKGVKETVDNYNKIPLEKRTTFNIWYDHLTNTVMLIRNDIFEQCGFGAERYEDEESGLLFLRYDDISDIIKDDYPYSGCKDISIPMLANIIRIYLLV